MKFLAGSLLLGPPRERDVEIVMFHQTMDERGTDIPALDLGQLFLSISLGHFDKPMLQVDGP